MGSYCAAVRVIGSCIDCLYLISAIGDQKLFIIEMKNPNHQMHDSTAQIIAQHPYCATRIPYSTRTKIDDKSLRR